MKNKCSKLLFNIILTVTFIFDVNRVNGFEKNTALIEQNKGQLLDTFNTETIFIKTVHSAQIFQVLSYFAYLLCLCFVIGLVIFLINVCVYILRNDLKSRNGHYFVESNSGDLETNTDSSIINVCPILNFKEYNNKI